jgi:hypothetical protein
MNPAICPICHEEIDGNDYRCAAFDRANWRTLVVHYPAPCWDRRAELAAPGVQVVGVPDPKAVPLVQFFA